MSKTVSKSHVAAIAALVALATNSSAFAGVEERWNAFQADPVQVMNQLPEKKVHKAKLFSAQDIASKEFVLKKGRVRNGEVGLSNALCDENGTCYKDVLDGRAGSRESAEKFFDPSEFKGRPPVLTLDAMEDAGLMSAELEETPWSDTYWPLYQGVLGSRYATDSFKEDKTWKGYNDFILKQDKSLQSIYNRGPGAARTKAINDLSPSEKYDLLIGDLSYQGTVYASGYLTPHMWAEGEAYWKDKNEVEPWMGICHGWAPAAYMLKRPKKVVEVLAADGRTKLKFYPSDIKGLGSYLWAKNQVPTRFIGGRCNDKDAPQDPDSGRILKEECFDTNPENWHKIIVNQIGIAKRSFVMDATFDYEVWNQPVHSYSYTYFNPQTGKEKKSLKQAIVPVESFTKDKFKKHRSKKTKFVVGINMETTYVVETDPSHAVEDSPASDSTNTASYMYDLELDENMNIIGGEWYTNTHPDFLWSPFANSRAMSVSDGLVSDSWDGKKELPQFWRDLAIMTAISGGVPLEGIVEGLISASRPAAE